MRFYTIGMAGHIDHGKTELTKALTGIETDRLKVEKERGISIEPGYAQYTSKEDMQVSIVDVPGHEKFIRQMIAGAVGIDLALLVVAADEGFMPQTKEHLEILSFLGIDNALIVVTKVDKNDAALLHLVKEDILTNIASTAFSNAEIHYVDSVTGMGIPGLRDAIDHQLKQVPARCSSGPFRMAIDQVFTIQGQGTIVRGTISEGRVEESERLLVMPQNEAIRVRQLQVHHKRVKEARAGQRAALNIAGIPKKAIRRGNVIVYSADHFANTKRMDVVLRAVKSTKSPLKQRAPVKVHIGTAIVMGKVIFFDRNDWKAGEEVLCQIELAEPVVAKRGDRLIVRRPSPAETIGGGSVIEAMAEKHRFGENTSAELQRKKDGTPEDRMIDLLREQVVLSENELWPMTGVSKGEFQAMIEDLEGSGTIRKLADGNLIVLSAAHEEKKRRLLDRLNRFHEQWPLRPGMDKQEMIHGLIGDKDWGEVLFEELKAGGKLKQHGPYLALAAFERAFPKEWEKRMVAAVKSLQSQRLEPEAWAGLMSKHGIPEQWGEELQQYLLWDETAYKLDESHLIHRIALEEAVKKLQENSSGSRFSLSLAKEALGLSRKYMIPFLELLDRLKYTVRDGNERKWIESTLNKQQ